MGFVSEHVGLRGDVRYHRDLQNPNNNGDFTIATGNFDFWRGTMGTDVALVTLS